MDVQPSPNGGNGRRDGGGRFKKGNRGGPGNPYAKQVARFRSMIHEAVTIEDLRAIVGMLVERAKDGDVVAAREILNRLVGKPNCTLDTERLQLEEARLVLRKREVELAEERLLF